MTGCVVHYNVLGYYNEPVVIAMEPTFDPPWQPTRRNMHMQALLCQKTNKRAFSPGPRGFLAMKTVVKMLLLCILIQSGRRAQANATRCMHECRQGEKGSS